jgi:hypothetical protein
MNLYTSMYHDGQAQAERPAPREQHGWRHVAMRNAGAVFATGGDRRNAPSTVDPTQRALLSVPLQPSPSYLCIHSPYINQPLIHPSGRLYLRSPFFRVRNEAEFARLDKFRAVPCCRHVRVHASPQPQYTQQLTPQEWRDQVPRGDSANIYRAAQTGGSSRQRGYVVEEWSRM